MFRQQHSIHFAESKEGDPSTFTFLVGLGNVDAHICHDNPQGLEILSWLSWPIKRKKLTIKTLLQLLQDEHPVF
jgi:hypothetical protein